MNASTRISSGHLRRKRKWPVHWHVLLLLLAACGAHAESVYRCGDAPGAVAFQATPCAEQTRQTVMAIRQQPLIDPGAPVAVMAPAGIHAGMAHPPGTRSRERRDHRRVRARKQPTSWECRASDGEVFYRHSRCPRSIEGDGVVRGDGRYLQSAHARSRGSRVLDAWGSLPVSGHPVARADACKQINGAGSAGRDGSAHDEQVSVYEHDLGRDPCNGY